MTVCAVDSIVLSVDPTARPRLWPVRIVDTPPPLKCMKGHGPFLPPLEGAVRQIAKEFWSWSNIEMNYDDSELNASIERIGDLLVDLNSGLDRIAAAVEAINR